MTILCFYSLSSLSRYRPLKNLRTPYPKLNPSSAPSILTRFAKSNNQFRTMISGTSSDPGPARPSSSARVFKIPELEIDQMDRVSDQNFQRYSSSSTRRNGNGVAIVWFRNDLRVLDNEALYKAWVSSEAVLPVYCVDPRLFGTTQYFGFPKTGGISLSLSLFD